MSNYQREVTDVRSGWTHVIGLAAFGSLLLYLFPPSGIHMDMLGNALQVIAAELGFGYTLQAARAFAPEDRVRRGWMLLAVGHGLSFVAFLLFGLLELGGSTDMLSSFADLAWVISNGFVLAVLGLMLVRPMWLQQGQEFRLIELLLLMYYPLFGALMLGGAWYMALTLYPLGRGALAWPWMAIVAGLVVTALSDAAHALLRLHGLYETGNLIDLGWVFYGLLMALGGFIQHRLMTADLGLKRREVAP